MVDSVQIVLFGVACGVGTDAVSQELLTFLHACAGRCVRHPQLVPFAASHAGGCRRYDDAADGGACRADPRGRHLSRLCRLLS